MVPSISTGAFILFACAIAVHSQEKTFLGDTDDGSRSTVVHSIKLYDEEGGLIRPDNSRHLPFSSRQTCGTCHNYAKISTGWHFNAVDTVRAGERNSEPWIFSDAETGTQVPLSAKGFPGTLKPEMVGLSPLQFLQKFGRHFPGGGIGEADTFKTAENYLRWYVSGNMEINCLGCHDADPAFDMAEFAKHMSNQSFRWAATGASSIAKVTGSAANMPDNYDIYRGTDPDNADNIPPTVHYDISRFNSNRDVFFDITKNVPNEKCYFCHSTKSISAEEESTLQHSEDIHMASGMQCVDCHRNNLNHDMIRGYEERATSASLSCEGCHISDPNNERPAAGSFGAPIALHSGMPSVHFKKLQCTACHSGPWPSYETGQFKTSRAHALGTHRAAKEDDAPPVIAGPVFKRDRSGMTAPHKMITPSYWAYQFGDSLQPILPEKVKPFVRELFREDSTWTPRDWASFTEAQTGILLDSLAAQDSTADATVLVSGGKLIKNVDGMLVHASHPAAAPYAWPIAHDVRPAAQALGVRGCDDCHSIAAPFYFGETRLTSVISDEKGTTAIMAEYMELSPTYARVLGAFFIFRPVLKVLLFLAVIFTAAILLVCVYRGITHLLNVVQR